MKKKYSLFYDEIKTSNVECYDIDKQLIEPISNYPSLFYLGTKWLIAEHRKCIAELKKLKIMIADMSKYIGALREKGRDLFNSYLALKKHLEELRFTIDKLERNNNQKKEIITQVRNEMESWKSKARDLQTQLDELRTKFRDLEQEHKDMAQKQVQCDGDIGTIEEILR